MCMHQLAEEIGSLQHQGGLFLEGAMLFVILSHAPEGSAPCTTHVLFPISNGTGQRRLRRARRGIW